MIRQYADLRKLRKDVTRLVFEGLYEIRWRHIKLAHTGIRESEILNTLLYGLYEFDKTHEGRYISRARSYYRRYPVRVVFEVRTKDEWEVAIVITAFEEE